MTSDSVTHSSGKFYRQRFFPFLVGAVIFLAIFYSVLILLAPLSELRLSLTPIGQILPWLLEPARWLEQSSNPPWLASLCLGLSFIGLLSIYGGTIFFVLRTSPPVQQSRRLFFLIIVGAFIPGLLLLFQPALFSDNVFTSMVIGRLVSVYSMNPFHTMPAEVVGDPYLPWMLASDSYPRISGPLWILCSAAFAAITNDPLVSLFLFKGFALFCHMLNIWLIWVLLTVIAPARRLSGTLLYAWCPLVLIESAGSGQSESMLVTLSLLAMLLSLLALRSKRGDSKKASSFWLLQGSALLFWGLALSANWVTLLITPLVLWFMQSDRRISRTFLMVSWQLLVVLLPEIVFLSLFWRGPETLFAITSSIDMAHFVHAPISLLTPPIHFLFRWAADSFLSSVPGVAPANIAADLTVRASATLVFILIYTHLFNRVRSAALRKGDEQEQRVGTLVDCCGIAIFWYLILVSGWFWPWYILWFLWLIVLRRIDTFTFTILLLSGTALLIYTFVGGTGEPLVTYQAAAIFGIPLLYLLVVRSSGERAERKSGSDVQRSSTT